MRPSPHAPETKLPPIAVRIPEACRLTGIGRSKLYELIKAREIEVVKIGSMTLVPMTNIERMIHREQESDDAASSGKSLRSVMHPALAAAVLTAAIAKAPEGIRRDLSSRISEARTSAEDTLVKRIVAALYDDNRESVARPA